MIRIFCEFESLVITFDSKKELDHAIHCFEHNEFTGTLGVLAPMKTDGMLTALENVRWFKNTPEESYPAGAGLFDDKIDPQYRDKLMDKIMEMVRAMTNPGKGDK